MYYCVGEVVLLYQAFSLECVTMDLLEHDDIVVDDERCEELVLASTNLRGEVEQ